MAARSLEYSHVTHPERHGPCLSYLECSESLLVHLWRLGLEWIFKDQGRAWGKLLEQCTVNSLNIIRTVFPAALGTHTIFNRVCGMQMLYKTQLLCVYLCVYHCYIVLGNFLLLSDNCSWVLAVPGEGQLGSEAGLRMVRATVSLLSSPWRSASGLSLFPWSPSEAQHYVWKVQ